MVVHVEDADHERVIGPNRSCGKPSDRPSGGGPASLREVRDPRRAASISRVKSKSSHCNNCAIKILETRSSSRLTPSCGVAWTVAGASAVRRCPRGRRRSESDDPSLRIGRQAGEAVDLFRPWRGGRRRPRLPAGGPAPWPWGWARVESVHEAGGVLVCQADDPRPTRRRDEIADVDRPSPPGQGLKPPRVSAPVPPANPSAPPRRRGSGRLPRRRTWG